MHGHPIAVLVGTRLPGKALLDASPEHDYIVFTRPVLGFSQSLSEPSASKGLICDLILAGSPPPNVASRGPGRGAGPKDYRDDPCKIRSKPLGIP